MPPKWIPEPYQYQCHVRVCVRCTKSAMSDLACTVLPSRVAASTGQIVAELVIKRRADNAAVWRRSIESGILKCGGLASLGSSH